MKNKILALVAALTLLSFAAVPAFAVTEHCPEGGTKTEAVGNNLNDIVLPEGTSFCVKGSTEATGFLVADGETPLGAYLGTGHDVSYYVVYPTASPTPTPVASPTPTPEPSPTPTPEATPTPTPEATPTPTPVDSPSPSVEPTPNLTLPPTDTATDGLVNAATTFIWIYIALIVFGFLLAVGLFVWMLKGFRRK